MGRFREPFDWEKPAPQTSRWGLTHMWGMKVMSVELCPDCTDDQRGAKVIETKDLCPPCRLATEARMLTG